MRRKKMKDPESTNKVRMRKKMEDERWHIQLERENERDDERTMKKENMCWCWRRRGLEEGGGEAGEKGEDGKGGKEEVEEEEGRKDGERKRWVMMEEKER